MEFVCDSKYIILPASDHAQKKRLLFYIDGTLVYDLVISLDYDEPDYRFPINMERFRGKTIRVACGCDIDIVIEKSETAPFERDGKYRPLAHYTAARGWLNDPNGLVFYNGKYLMFYQHNPAATTWENMHWGAAESNDLIHWQERDDALFPDEMGTVFSGSAIVDRKNVTGLKQGDEDTVLFFYTCAGNTSKASKGKPFTQNLAYSTDGGKTLVRYGKNPLIGQIVEGNRDPKVIYYEPDDSYIMALFLDGHEFALFRSKNLLDWEEIQRIELPGDAECPDFYPLALDGDKDNEKWIFSAASDRYYIGSFDGGKFVPETEQLCLNYGNSSYAAQSWSDVSDGRRIRTAFVTVVIPGMPFGSCMDIPQEMTLRTVNGALRLCANPVPEIEKLYVDTNHFENFYIISGENFKQKMKSKCCDIMLRIECGSSFQLSLFGLDIEYRAAENILKCLEKEAFVQGEGGFLTLRVIFDTVYTEIFADGGSVFMGMTYIQDNALNRLTISSENAYVEKLTVSEMKKFY